MHKQVSTCARTVLHQSSLSCIDQLPQLELRHVTVDNTFTQPWLLFQQVVDIGLTQACKGKGAPWTQGCHVR